MSGLCNLIKDFVIFTNHDSGQL
uniref:Uncharacterized protein n=1 Tax=Arundo donax TaxID=35708 RepID=A0A0A9B4F6_ARUDO